MLFYKLFISFKIDKAMNFLISQVEFLSQISDRIKNSGAINGQIW